MSILEISNRERGSRRVHSFSSRSPLREEEERLSLRLFSAETLHVETCRFHYLERPTTRSNDCNVIDRARARVRAIDHETI